MNNTPKPFEVWKMTANNEPDKLLLVTHHRDLAVAIASREPDRDIIRGGRFVTWVSK